MLHFVPMKYIINSTALSLSLDAENRLINNSNKKDPYFYREKWIYSDSITDSFHQIDRLSESIRTCRTHIEEKLLSQPLILLCIFPYEIDCSPVISRLLTVCKS